MFLWPKDENQTDHVHNIPETTQQQQNIKRVQEYFSGYSTKKNKVAATFIYHSEGRKY